MGVQFYEIKHSDGELIQRVGYVDPEIKEKLENAGFYVDAITITDNDLFDWLEEIAKN